MELKLFKVMTITHHQAAFLKLYQINGGFFHQCGDIFKDFEAF
jgi:hypothetical protein